MLRRMWGYKKGASIETPNEPENWTFSDSISKIRRKGNFESTRDSTISIKILQDLRDVTWKKAMKYRFDPFIGPIYQDYLDDLNTIIQELEHENRKS